MRLFADSSLASGTIWTEAEGEPYEDKLMVAEVIRNRTRQKYSSDGTVASTIARRYQFSALNDDSADNIRLIASLKLDDNDPIVKDCLRAWYQATTFNTNLAKGAVLYYNPQAIPIAPAWVAKSKEVARGKHHIFYIPLI